MSSEGQGHWSFGLVAYEFQIVFNCNYGPILHRLRVFPFQWPCKTHVQGHPSSNVYRPFDSQPTVSYWHSIASMALSLGDPDSVTLRRCWTYSVGPMRLLIFRRKGLFTADQLLCIMLYEMDAYIYCIYYSPSVLHLKVKDNEFIKWLFHMG